MANYLTLEAARAALRSSHYGDRDSELRKRHRIVKTSYLNLETWEHVPCYTIIIDPPKRKAGGNKHARKRNR